LGVGGGGHNPSERKAKNKADRKKIGHWGLAKKRLGGGKGI